MSSIDPTNVNDYLASLHILRPAGEYHEDYGTALWWHLPIEEPPHIGSPLDLDWDVKLWCGQTPAEYYTHWSPLPNARMFRASNGVSVTDRNDHLPLPRLNCDLEEEVARLRAKVSKLITESDSKSFTIRDLRKKDKLRSREIIKLNQAASDDLDQLLDTQARLKDALDFIETAAGGEDWLAERQIPCPMRELNAAIMHANQKTLRRIAELESALEKYGAHLPNCAQVNKKGGGFAGLCFTENCDCGFDVLDVESPRSGPADAMCKALREIGERINRFIAEVERREVPGE